RQFSVCDLPPSDGSSWILPRELRRDRSMAHEGRGGTCRRFRPAGRWHGGRWPCGAASGAVETPRNLRTHDDGKAADVQSGTRSRVLRYAGRPRHRAGRARQQLPGFVARHGNRQEHAVSNEESVRGRVMFITKKHLPRRTFLRGMGATVALPLLDAMVPARTLLAKTAASPAPRLGFVYLPHGAIMDKWTPAAEGAGFEFSPILKPLEPFRDCLNVVSGLGHRAADTTAVHSLSPTTWLSGVRPKPTQGLDAFAGVTADQIAAQRIGQDTLLPSIELASEDQAGLIGACDRDYGCI